MAGKTEKTNMYIFDETTYHKELILKNRKNYALKAKKIGKAVLFMKLFEDLKANKEPIAEDISKLKEIIEEWKAEAPDDLNCVLASILVNAQDGSVEDAKAEFEQAKSQYTAEDEEIIPWFESQIDNLTHSDEEAAAE